MFNPEKIRVKEIFKSLPLFLKDDFPTKKYKEDLFSENVHYGQRKLFLTVLHFLTMYTKEFTNFVCVYVGAGGGVNNYILAGFFPNGTFHFYDDVDLGYDEKYKELFNNFTYHKKYFEDSDVEYWKEYNKVNKNVFFISDIRSTNDNNKNITLDMEMQEKWTTEIDPVKAHLKFRIPYLKQSKDKNTDTFFPYLGGIIYFQPWAPTYSTECRLVPEKIDNNYYKVKYSTRKHEMQMFYFNTEIREKTKYPHLFSENNLRITNDLLLNYDSYLELYILTYYLGMDNFDKVLNLSNKISFLLNDKWISIERLDKIVNSFSLKNMKYEYFLKFQQTKFKEDITDSELLKLDLEKQLYIRRRLTQLKNTILKPYNNYLIQGSKDSNLVIVTNKIKNILIHFKIDNLNLESNKYGVLQITDFSERISGTLLKSNTFLKDLDIKKSRRIN